MATTQTVQELRNVFAVTLARHDFEVAAFRGIVAAWRARRRRRALVIDDNEPLTRVVGRILAAMGLSSEAVTSGEEGIARARAAAFDLVVIDLNMPMPGMRVVEEIRQESARPLVAILIVSGAVSQDEADVIACECGADAALAKPFAVEDFEAVVRRLLERSARPSFADLALAEAEDDSVH